MDRKEAIETMVLKREKIIGTISSLSPKARERSNLHKEIEAYTMAIEALQEPERPKGHWINGEPCPICGEDRFEDLYADIWADWTPPFCPNCGADMRGEKK